MDARKRYRARITLGVETDTYDAVGEVQAAATPPASRAPTSETPSTPSAAS